MTLHRDVTGMMVNVIPKWPQVPAIFRLENYHYLATLYMYIYIYIYCMYISHTYNRQYAMINFAYVYYTYIYIHTYIHTHTHIHTHTYIHTYIHGHVHTYIYIPTYTHAFQAQERPCHRGVNMGGRPKLARV